jgi:hypothetical protein
MAQRLVMASATQPSSATAAGAARSSSTGRREEELGRTQHDQRPSAVQLQERGAQDRLQVRPWQVLARVQLSKEEERGSEHEDKLSLDLGLDLRHMCTPSTATGNRGTAGLHRGKDATQAAAFTCHERLGAVHDKNTAGSLSSASR